MSLLYRLPAYDEQGNGREVSFGTERQLREGAYLKLEIEPIRGVVGWEEVSFDELPQEAQAHLHRVLAPAQKRSIAATAEWRPTSVFSLPGGRIALYYASCIVRA